MKNISLIKDCYGCGVCSASCPKNIISMQLNQDGFYEPKIVDIDKCIGCGICVDVCGFSHQEIALKDCSIRSWAGWSNDELVRKKCSSGGIGFEIGKQLITEGYKAVGCRYNVNTQRAEHYIASTVEEFIQSIGSKYIQSFTEEAFKQINRKDKYLITGTPCQIDSFRRMIQKFHLEENFVLMDFFCHSVPSMFAWKAYIKMLEPQIGEITYASWRNKFQYGWHDSWIMGIDGEKTSKPIEWHDSYNLLIKEKKTYIQSRMSQGDLFYRLFLGDFCANKACIHNCKYKYNHSSADIRIGDLWGETYKDNKEGVSAIITFTEKGYSIIKNMKDITLMEHPFEVVAEGQMKRNVKSKELKPIIIYMLHSGYDLEGTCFKLILGLQRGISKIKKIFNL